MITEEQINKIAQKQQTSIQNIRREYVQQLYLSYFYQQPHASNIFFKGGTALRIVYNSPRFSEDLDFSSPLQSIREIETAVLSTLQAIEKEGLQAEVSESKETTGGYLGIILFQLRDQKVTIQIEISFREKDTMGEVVTIKNDFIPTYTIVRITQELLVKGKIQALLARGKPRDYYDLYFMLRASLLTQQERHILPQVVKNLKETKVNFEKELKEFLPKSHWMIIRDFKSTLERELERFL